MIFGQFFITQPRRTVMLAGAIAAGKFVQISVVIFYNGADGALRSIGTLLFPMIFSMRGCVINGVDIARPVRRCDTGHRGAQRHLSFSLSSKQKDLHGHP